MIPALAPFADLLRRSTAVTPRICDGCGRTFTRLTPAQCAQVGSDRLPSCRRRGCDGLLYPVWPNAVDGDDERLRRAIREHAEQVIPSNGLPAIQTRTSKTAAPGESGAAAEPNSFRELKDMTTIIQRHARDLHAGDVIVYDPDHDRPVRWRVSRPPVITGDGAYALADYLDLEVDRHGILYFRVLANLSVEPVGGAQ